MRALLFILIGALALVAAPEINVTGKWSGTAKITDPDGQTKDSPALLLLKQNGSEISGTVGPHEGEQHAITKGKIAGDKITILMEDEGRTIKFDLVLASDRLTGDVNVVLDGQTSSHDNDQWAWSRSLTSTV